MGISTDLQRENCFFKAIPFVQETTLGLIAQLHKALTAKNASAVKCKAQYPSQIYLHELK